MRRRDYRCTGCGLLFEFVDSINDPIYEHLPCPDCRQPAKRQIAIPTIGKIDRGTFVTDFPKGRDANGRMTYTTLARDEVERRLDQEPPNPFDDTYLEKTRERRADQLERIIAKADAGELPPPKELTQQERDTLAKALVTGE